MGEFFGEFSWPKAVELFPVYAGAFLTVGVIFYQIAKARSEAESRAAFDYFLNETKDEILMKSRNEFLQLRKLFPDVMKLFENEEENQNEFDTLRYMLNRYETFSAGVLHHGISENFAYMMWRGSLINDCKYLIPFILKLQELTENDKIGEQFISLAKKWAEPDDNFEEFLLKFESK